MAQSINHVAELTTPATLFSGLDVYGNIMTGDMGFEFYSSRNPEKNIQIPWGDIRIVMASILFKGKWIPRFSIELEDGTKYMFAARQARDLLKNMQTHIPPAKMYRSWTLWDVIKRNFQKKKR